MTDQMEADSEAALQSTMVQMLKMILMILASWVPAQLSAQMHMPAQTGGISVKSKPEANLDSGGDASHTCKYSYIVSYVIITDAMLYRKCYPVILSLLLLQKRHGMCHAITCVCVYVKRYVFYFSTHWFSGLCFGAVTGVCLLSCLVATCHLTDLLGSSRCQLHVSHVHVLGQSLYEGVL